MNLPENIYRLRTQAGMSQEDLAGKLEVSRQSVSKWETGAAVPDLDKLMNMSKLFGITLDELVGGEPMAAAAGTTQCQPSSASNSQRICGVCLLVGGLVVFLLLSLLGGLAFGLLFSIPLLIPGLICLLAKKHAGLKCAWVEFVLLAGFLSFATGTNWNTVFAYIRLLAQGYDQVYTSAHILISLGMLLLLAGLLLWTVCTYRREIKPYTGKSLILMGCGCVLYLLTRIPLVQIPEGAIRIYAIVTQVLMWVRLFLGTVLLTFSWAYFRQWRQKRS